MSDACIPTGKMKESYPDVPESVVAGLLRGAVDLHCHSGPSVMPRSLNHLEAIREAQDAGMHAVLFKDHYYSVTPVVELLKETMPDLRLTLLTRRAAQQHRPAASILTPSITASSLARGWSGCRPFSAANHIRHGHRHTILPTKFEMLRPTGLTVVTDKGDLKDEVKPILDQIAEFDCVLSSRPSAYQRDLAAVRRKPRSAASSGCWSIIRPSSSMPTCATSRNSPAWAPISSIPSACSSTRPTTRNSPARS